MYWRFGRLCPGSFGRLCIQARALQGSSPDTTICRCRRNNSITLDHRNTSATSKQNHRQRSEDNASPKHVLLPATAAPPGLVDLCIQGEREVAKAKVALIGEGFRKSHLLILKVGLIVRHGHVCCVFLNGSCCNAEKMTNDRWCEQPINNP